MTKLEKEFKLIIILLLIFLYGCVNDSIPVKQDKKVVDENISKEETDNLLKNTDKQNVEEKMTERLGESDSESVNGIEKTNKKNIDKCNDGFVYNSELDQCFEIGKNNEGQTDSLNIDPVVKECNDRGGIYNAQIGKCFTSNN